MSLTYHTLMGWPEDRLPTCSYESCGQEIRNGERYVVVPDTLRLLCSACAPTMQSVVAQEELDRHEDVEQSKPHPHTTAPAAIRVRAAYEQVTRASQTRRASPLPKPARARRPARGMAFPPCAYCGAPCPGRGGRKPKQRYCSREHASAHRVETNDVIRKAREIACPGCGVRFIPPLHGARGPQKFCRLSCAGFHRRKLQPRICEPCGTEFAPERQTQIYCSRDCQYYGQRGRKNPRPLLGKWSRRYDKCVDCGETKRRHKGGGRCSRCYYPPEISPKNGEKISL